MNRLDLERKLGQALLHHPANFNYRYDDDAKRDLTQLLFRCLTGYNDEYLRMLFPDGTDNGCWKLSEAQGAKEGAEYSEAARGKRCGHVFKVGEATYRCMTCSTDETCALCSRCFDASDHSGHKYSVYVSSGHSGCCDCGDDEAFRIPVNCAIHTDLGRSTGKEPAKPYVPEQLVEYLQTTLSRTFDYFCDVISCSPEQLRLPKTEEGIRQDEVNSRLSSEWYGGSDLEDDEVEFSLVLWNDEKHTINEVTNQVSRACRERERFGIEKANETNDIGRSVVKYSKDLSSLLRVSKIIEQIRVTVTVRSARDTYREQMCDTIIEWFADIAGCYVGDDNTLLRHIICEQMLHPWRPGSRASNAAIGKKGIDDHTNDEGRGFRAVIGIAAAGQVIVETEFTDDEMDDDNAIDEIEGEGDEGGREDEDEEMDEVGPVHVEEEDLAAAAATAGPGLDQAAADIDMMIDDEMEDAGFSPPRPRPPPIPEPEARTASSTAPAESESQSELGVKIPKTPGLTVNNSQKKAVPYWQIKPQSYHEKTNLSFEDLRVRTRLDWLILYDLRLWKKTRTDVRELCLGTVVNVPEFKRILGLRFSALYTALAQLYLIADREPDHSIIKLSLQLLTTPSITKEVVERGNFLTNIMAILYTFLTTRQVGEPQNVNPFATLAMDSGSITNRRLYHFFLDLRYLLPAEHVQTKIRTERQYLRQFLDLVKLTQGICPNVRAVGEHVEYETDAWIGASILMREITRLCRLFCEAFRPDKLVEGEMCLVESIKATALATMFNSLGLEHKRFDQAEIKEPIRFKSVPYVDFEVDALDQFSRHRIVDFVVDRGSISFHHALHYTISWLLECGRGMSPDTIRDALIRAAEIPRQQFNYNNAQYLSSEDAVLAMFDFPLRVCAWLAQMKAGMWVRNGMSLRHQMGQYRAVLSRDVAYYRDIFMIQAAFATCDPSRFLATISDRFGMTDWMKGGYEVRPGYDEAQHVDVAEEFIHLLVILISERTSLAPFEDEATIQNEITRRDIAHTLCFKPLSYTDLTARISDKIVDSDDFQDLLEEVATFRSPDGLNDTGTFELKPEYIELVDPYAAQYSKNQRDEAENIFKQWKAKSGNRKAADVVFEPKLKPIPSGLFSGLSDFTRTPLFAQLIHHFMEYSLMYKICTPTVTPTRVEALLHILLHLVLLAVKEDKGSEHEEAEKSPHSFVIHALCKTKSTQLGELSIVGLLQRLSTVSDFESCGPKIRHILRGFWQKHPDLYSTATSGLSFPFDQIDSPSPAPGPDNEAEQKKKRALERQAKIMAQFQQQQQTFLSNQETIDWGEEDLSEPEESSAPSSTEKKIWKYPSGNCILCQEDTNESKLYGTFALITDSGVFRQTDMQDEDFVREVLNTPLSLDRSADSIRPFGVAGENRERVRRLDSTGGEVISEKQGLGKGFPSKYNHHGPVTTGCGHIMHYACFEVYYNATRRRHNHQVARNHPERLQLNEFVCPLCKALGNAFLPIVWKGKEESYPSVLSTTEPFDEFLSDSVVNSLSSFRSHAWKLDNDTSNGSVYPDLFVDYISNNIIPSISSKVDNLLTPKAPEPVGFSHQPPRISMPGFFPTPDETPAAIPALHQLPKPAAPSESPLSELVSVYSRLRDTMRLNSIESQFEYQQSLVTPEDLIYTDSLIKSFGYTIAGVEISQRGVEAEPGTTLLSTIPQISLTHLRILSETAFSYASIGGLHNSSARKTGFELRDMHRRKACQLFLGHPELSGLAALARDDKSIEPLLSVDIFALLSECSLCLVPVMDVDIMHIVRICYAAEILKTMLAYLFTITGLGLEMTSGNSQAEGEAAANLSNEECSAVKNFLMWTLDAYEALPFEPDPSLRDVLQGYRKGDIPEHIIKGCNLVLPKYALPFLRKTAILLHVHYGVEFFNTGPESADMSEFDRLTALLRLPTLSEIFEKFTGPAGNSPLGSMAVGWIEHWRAARAAESAPDGSSMPLSLSHPAIFELVGLPKYFDFLLDEANQRRCPTTKKELTDPSICLFCGEIFCSQATCCLSSSKLGGCNTHLEKYVSTCVSHTP